MSKPVIICVDDEPLVLETLKIELKRVLGENCLIETAEGGEEALELFDELQNSKEYEVALVLADYIMPGLNGDQLLKQIHDRSPRTLNVMISGQADLEAVSQALRSARLYRYISKPWTPEDISLTIVEAVQSYLQDRKLETQTEKLRAINSYLEQQIQERTEELQQKMQELEKLNTLKDEFLHAVSHDLKTPLIGSMLVFQRLKKQLDDPVQLSRSMLDRMVESTQRQLKLLDSLLAVQLSEHGMRLDRQAIKLAAFVDEIILDLEPILTENQVTIAHTISSESTVYADEFQLRRVFENLITNSLKHNAPGISLSISTTVENHILKCMIEDNGVGIPQQDCDLMFERYQQGSRNRRSLGIGLGLYLCRQIIQAHGGEIGVISAVDQGAKFWFTLPTS
ncbi:PAS fold family protein [Leptolyngbya boryana NIES-2135]|jgi:two-component system sensor histidine kinase/response regulator|uniref:histidine kinase n=1 Tax=Leptolyngbya boryana NIES-2135 TaxID=1973484 RepID=A0A1Z4JCU9_LEPBY|nr:MULTISPECIES: hybrid sensor histidine kinase/response regulator [Leptolyngbya]BAY54530.1 PAS fold family protein [Leptolyngbya boryana NIES-2135]MBD2365523.1 hybrid sensor histidine kinase/response regulator [Leptolyngbya sp. FACHB-161]MBD2371703.1 hybrid sensor histidine kinase/response regulator [Leptolyngbya sp. FACHB-238]MBD2396128.1 hybrid sensor histidine kinase/response regulator [Leptolyngbya sp. FACHB-239]MBD2402651.1 hybrid sensor histidine kinase/response regulator [Leptolyngbya 